MNCRHDTTGLLQYGPDPFNPFFRRAVAFGNQRIGLARIHPGEVRKQGLNEHIGVPHLYFGVLVNGDVEGIDEDVDDIIGLYVLRSALKFTAMMFSASMTWSGDIGTSSTIPPSISILPSIRTGM